MAIAVCLLLAALPADQAFLATVKIERLIRDAEAQHTELLANARQQMALDRLLLKEVRSTLRYYPRSSEAAVDRRASESILAQRLHETRQNLPKLSKRQMRLFPYARPPFEVGQVGRLPNEIRVGEVLGSDRFVAAGNFKTTWRTLEVDRRIPNTDPTAKVIFQGKLRRGDIIDLDWNEVGFVCTEAGKVPRFRRLSLGEMLDLRPLLNPPEESP